jgi:hypothetical protein
MKSHPLHLSTPYQVTPLQLSTGRAVHRIGIHAEDEGSARVTLDPNVCQLDPFGDTAGCTKIAVFSFEARIRLLEERDGKRLFALDPDGPDQPSLRLALLPEQHPARATPARLLVLDEASAIKAVVALEREPDT